VSHRISFVPYCVLRIAFARAACALAVLVCAPLGAEEPLTLDEALRLAAERSQTLVAQDAAATAARHMAVAAGEPQDLVLVAGLDNVPVEGPDAWSLSRDFMTMRSIGVVRALTRDEKRTARAARFEHEAEAALAGRSLELANLQRETALAWFERHYAERRQGLLIAQRDAAVLTVEAADLAYRGGRGAQSDLFAARSTLAVVEDRIAANERDIGVARILLERWIGTAAERPLAAPPALDVAAVSDAELQAGVGHHPMITMLAWEEQAANAEAAVARASKRPDWSLDLRYGARGSAYADMVSINVSRPLQWRHEDRQDREVAAKLATADEMRARREEQARVHLAEARTLLETWQANRARLERYASTLIPLAAERTRTTTIAYGSGREPLSAVLDARAAELEARVAEVDLELETGRVWAELEYLVPAGGHTVAN
jgi:outer membrane protein TolC